MTTLLAGLDVGTTSIKCLVFDTHGNVVSRASTPTDWKLEHGQELAPESLRAAASSVVSEACSRAGQRVGGLGITGMAECGILLDETSRPTGPVVAWNDLRADAVADSVFATLDPQWFSQITGLPPSGRCTLAKLAWERHTGRNAAAVSWLGVPEWTATLFGAVPVAERSLASRTGLYDVRADVWIQAYLDAAGWDGLSLPRLADAGEMIGHVDIGHPLLDGAAIVIGGHDHLCAAVGAGATREGDLMDSMGTGEALSRVLTTAPEPGPAAAQMTDQGMTFGRHPLAGRFSLMAGLGSGVVLNEALRMAGLDPAAPDYLLRRGDLDAAAARVAPYPLVGAESGWEPWQDGALALLDNPAALWRAVLAMVARRARATADSLDRFAGRRERIVASGGWLRSDLVRHTKHEELGPYAWASLDEPGAYGAAVLSGRAIGLDPHLPTTTEQQGVSTP